MLMWRISADKTALATRFLVPCLVRSCTRSWAANATCGIQSRTPDREVAIYADSAKAKGAAGQTGERFSLLTGLGCTPRVRHEIGNRFGGTVEVPGWMKVV